MSKARPRLAVHKWFGVGPVATGPMCGRPTASTSGAYAWAQVTCKRCLLRKGRP
jgi:hypothetical protein